jgi:hypothetical protein
MDLRPERRPSLSCDPILLRRDSINRAAAANDLKSEFGYSPLTSGIAPIRETGMMTMPEMGAKEFGTYSATRFASM